LRVLIDYRPALVERSGAGEYTHQLARALLSSFAATNGALELTLFSSSWNDRVRGDPELARAAIVDRRVPVRLLNLAWHRLEWPPAEALGGSRFDVMHSSHPLLMPARKGAQIVTIHDLDFLKHPERTRAEIRRDYPTLAADHARRAHGIIVPSRFSAGEVARQFGLPLEKIAVCSPGAPPWAPRRDPPSDGYVLFFSTLEPRKNVGGLLDAYERLLARRQREAPHLVLAGKATDASGPWLSRLERPPLLGRARHIGYVPPDKRQEVYAGARLLVQPSFEEGFGLPVLEAMTLGVPGVAAGRGSLPEVLGDAGPLVDPGDPDAMAAAIDRLLADREYAQACSARGIARAREFSWASTAARVYELYQRAIERRRCGSA
jgi:glycosyltransferase involved in cell wall biosynthesis